MAASGFLLGTRRRAGEVLLQIEWDDAALTGPMETTLAYFGFERPRAASDSLPSSHRGGPVRLSFSAPPPPPTSTA